MFDNAAGLATAQCKQEEGAQRELHCDPFVWVMLTDGGAFYYVGAYLPDLVQPQKEAKKPAKQGRNLGENVDISRLFQTFIAKRKWHSHYVYRGLRMFKTGIKNFLYNLLLRQ